MKIRGLYLRAPWFLRSCKLPRLVWDSTYKSRGFAWSARAGSTIRANFCILCRFQRIKRGGLRGGRFSCKDQRGLYETIMQTLRFLAVASTFPQDSAAGSLSASCKPPAFLRAEPEKCKPLRLMQDLAQKTWDSACLIWDSACLGPLTFAPSATARGLLNKAIACSISGSRFCNKPAGCRTFSA